LLILAAFFSIYGLNEHICSTMREELTRRREETMSALQQPGKPLAAVCAESPENA
jgi:hypothetical protein